MGSSGKDGPSGAWFILPSLLLLAGVLLAGIGISSFVQFVRSDFRAYQPDSSISVSKDGFTLYAEAGTTEHAEDGTTGPAEDGTTEPADLRCAVTGPDGQVRLQSISGRNTWSNDRGTFVAIASTPKDLPAGRYVISCEGPSAGPDVPLYLGPRLDLAAVGRLAVFGIVAPMFLGLCSVVLFAILAFLRHRSRTTSTAGNSTAVG